MSKSSIVPVKDELKKAFEVIKGEQIPSVPDIIINLHAEFEKEEPDTERVSDLVSKDQAITGQVLKAVNAPIFGLQQPVESITQAVVLLGLVQIKNLVTAAAFQSRMQARSPAAMQIWHDSLSVAQVAMKIAQLIQGVSLDEVYMAALLHNCGAMLLAEKFPGYGELLQMENDFPVAFIDRENRQLGSNHVVIGYMFAKHWKLSERVCQAIYHHHDLNCEWTEDSKLRALIAILKVAYSLVREKRSIDNLQSLESIQFLSYAKQELMLDEEVFAGLRTDAILEQG